MELIQKITEIINRAGEIMLSAKDVGSVTTQKTSAADLVTAYDVQIEGFLKEQLLPLVEGSIFYGEEEKENQDPRKGWAYIVDPIDGTANFTRDFSQSAISIALLRDGVPQYAVVLDPYRKELYTAKRGCGAFCNGQRIHVSTRPLSQGIFGMGTSPYNLSLHKPTLEITARLFDRSCDFRRMGAAVPDLCAVACGRLDAFFECQLSPWDYAAGSLLVEEAGGHISTLRGEPLPYNEKCSVWASNDVNNHIREEIMEDISFDSFPL